MADIWEWYVKISLRLIDKNVEDIGMSLHIAFLCSCTIRNYSLGIGMPYIQSPGL